jgi:hypothetical protein
MNGKPKRCLYCGNQRKLNTRLSCRECQGRQDADTCKTAYSVMMNGTGEDEDRIAPIMWDILDGKPGKPFVEMAEL